MIVFGEYGGQKWLEDEFMCRKKLSPYRERPRFTQFKNEVKFRILNEIDKYTCECLAIKVNRRLNPYDVVGVFTKLFIQRGGTVHIPSGISPEFIAKRVRDG